MLSASNFGVLFGSQIFGWIGDRYGRKTALILANFLFGVLTFAAAYSTNLTELSWLRFLAGLGIGGVSRPLRSRFEGWPNCEGLE